MYVKLIAELFKKGDQLLSGGLEKTREGGNQQPPLAKATSAPDMAEFAPINQILDSTSSLSAFADLFHFQGRLNLSRVFAEHRLTDDTLPEALFAAAVR